MVPPDPLLVSEPSRAITTDTTDTRMSAAVAQSPTSSRYVGFPETGAPKPDRSGVVSRNAVFLPLTVLHRRKCR